MVLILLLFCFAEFHCSARDTPDSLPSFVGENEAKKGCTITQMGDNVFAAVQ